MAARDGKPTAEQFTAAQRFLTVELKSARKQISHQQFLTLRGQAIHGDIEGAHRGLMRILGRHEK